MRFRNVWGVSSVLSSELWAQLELCWVKQGAAVAARLRPGLTWGEMDELTRPVGIALPDEARLWWSWHDGADPQRNTDIAANLGPGRAFRPLAKAVARCRELRASYGVDGGLGEGRGWGLAWLPIDTWVAPTVFDCSGPSDAPVHVRAFDVVEPEAGADGAGSIGELVELYVRAVEAGGWRWNKERMAWDQDEVILNGLLGPGDLNLL
jgi:hypothetical protein